ncbi:interleukin-21 receptor [Bombina bombina]|uniref:interleukin-21 receptor n=1 Tax=Bombina bombina TaxID=8345 RepID=UPI00235A7149|nr:interleukin-21 receptor [Bombina bombina]
MSKKGDVLTTSLLLSFFIRLCFSCKDLHCFGDYIDTFTCRYDADREENSDISYILSAAWTSEDEDLNISCLLTQSYNKHEQTCNVDMAYYGAEVTFNISITQTISGKHNFTQMCGPFNLSDNFVPVAPFNLTVTFYENYNISWRTAYESELHFLKNGELQYQLSYKTEKESWKTQKYVHILEDEKNVQILKSSFQEDTNYVARIRSKPKSTSPLYSGEWSEWSDFVTWRTHFHGDPSWTMKFWIPILCGTTFIAMILMFKHLQLPQRLWKNEWVFIPSPAPFFKPLYTGHNGDFKSWLRCPLNMTTLQFDGGVILPEVLEISSRSFLKPGVDDIERHEKILSCKACRVNECAKCRCNTLSRDRLTDHIFVDTVTNEEVHDSLQCIASTQPSVNSDDEEGHENNCYPSLSLDSDQEHLLNHLLPDNSNSVALLNYKTERGLDHQSTLRSNMNILGAIFLPLEEWELPASHSPDDVNVFYNNDNYESYSPISENSIDFGYPRLCLDLDTIDSGFADSECGSPVESDVSPKLSSSESFIEQEDVCQRNYVKQWVPCNSSSINDSAIN